MYIDRREREENTKERASELMLVTAENMEYITEVTVSRMKTQTNT